MATEAEAALWQAIEALAGWTCGSEINGPALTFFNAESRLAVEVDAPIPLDRAVAWRQRRITLLRFAGTDVLQHLPRVLAEIQVAHERLLVVHRAGDITWYCVTGSSIRGGTLAH